MTVLTVDLSLGTLLTFPISGTSVCAMQESKSSPLNLSFSPRYLTRIELILNKQSSNTAIPNQGSICLFCSFNVHLVLVLESAGISIAKDYSELI